MAFYKKGDAQPIINIVDADEKDEKTKKALEDLKQDTKNIAKNGNKIELSSE